MFENGYIDRETMEAAQAEPLATVQDGERPSRSAQPRRATISPRKSAGV
jgi:hypothetical protein